MSDTRRESIHDAVDALFDAELERDDARRLLDEADAATCERIAKTHRVVSMLRAPVSAPDQTEAILARVEDEREFLESPWRRAVRVGRLAVAACLLLTLMGVAVAQRVWPDATSWRHESRPVSALLQTTEREAAEGVRAIGGCIDEALDATRQVTGELRFAVRDSREAPAKIRAESRHVLVLSAPAHDVRVRATLTPVATPGASGPATDQDAWHFAWRGDAHDRLAGTPAIGSGVSVRASLIGVWTADPAPASATMLPIGAFERHASPSVPGIQLTGRSTTELP